MIFSSHPKCEFKITSGFRTIQKNKEVGGAKNSYHLHGRAFDLVTNCRKEFVKEAMKKGLSIIKYPTHIHVDNRSRQVCLIKRKKGFTYCPI